MRLLYTVALLMLLSLASFGQAPLLLPTRNLAEELSQKSNLGWRGLFLGSTMYQPVGEEWLTNSFLPKYQMIVKRLRMKSNAEGFDCDNFAELFRTQLNVENHLAGNSNLGEVACGILVVQQQRSWGKVLATRGSLHALIIVRTDNGWKVVEPQTMRVASI